MGPNARVTEDLMHILDVFRSRPREAQSFRFCLHSATLSEAQDTIFGSVPVKVPLLGLHEPSSRTAI